MSLKIDTKNILIDKLLKAYELRQQDIAEVVELYYDAQDLRKMHANRLRSEAPNELAAWLTEWLAIGEHLMQSKLRKWVESETTPPETKWAFAQTGIGPVIAAALAAYIDPVKFATISKLWKYSGQVTGFDRPKAGIKLCYNKRLKVLCWKLGDSFVKQSGRPKAVYGALYRRFKEEEIAKNNDGRLVSAAQRELATKAITDKHTRAVNASGKLIDAHLDNRARRKVIKRFLADYWQVGRQARNLPVSAPYVFSVLGHAPEHYEPPPPPYIASGGFRILK